MPIAFLYLETFAIIYSPCIFFSATVAQAAKSVSHADCRLSETEQTDTLAATLGAVWVV